MLEQEPEFLDPFSSRPPGEVRPANLARVTVTVALRSAVTREYALRNILWFVFHLELKFAVAHGRNI